MKDSKTCPDSGGRETAGFRAVERREPVHRVQHPASPRLRLAMALAILLGFLFGVPLLSDALLAQRGLYRKPGNDGVYVTIEVGGRPAYMKLP